MNLAPQGEALAAARIILAYLAESDALPAAPADAVIGFGTFDVALASYCGKLFTEGRARRIIFTGGIGAATADLGMPEADAWQLTLARTHPAIPPEAIIIENRSTNTAENIAFTAALLARSGSQFTFGGELQRALIVAAPSRLRRVKLTLQHMQPALQVTRCTPTPTLEREFAVHEAKGFDYVGHLLGELDRIEQYPSRGWISHEPLPPEIIRAKTTLTHTKQGGRAVMP